MALRWTRKQAGLDWDGILIPEQLHETCVGCLMISMVLIPLPKHRTSKNKTTGVKLGAQAELAGFPLTVGAGFGVFHNNYNGWGIEQSLNAAISLGQKSKGELNSGDTHRRRFC